MQTAMQRAMQGAMQGAMQRTIQRAMQGAMQGAIRLVACHRSGIQELWACLRQARLRKQLQQQAHLHGAMRLAKVLRGPGQTLLQRQ